MELVDDGIIDIHKAIEKVSSTLQKILNIENRNFEKKNASADFCIFRREEWVFDTDNSLSLGQNNPLGKKFSTKVVSTIRKGKIVYQKK